MKRLDQKTNVIGIKQKVKAIVEQEKEIYGQSESLYARISSRDVLDALCANEDGDAWLFANLNKDKFCYDHNTKDWYRWKTHYWEPDIVNNVLTAIDSAVEVYSQEATKQGSIRVIATKNGENSKAKKAKGLEDELIKRINNLQGLSRKKHILILAAAGDHSLGIKGDEWDTNPYLIGCNNGVIELNTGNFREGKPDEYIKTIAPIDWKGIDEPAPYWEKFIRDIFDNKKELIEYNQRLLGYCISGLTVEHIVVILWGKGRNGKGTLFEVLKVILGDLIKPIQAEMLLRQPIPKNSASPSSDIMSLIGKRLVWASESDEGRQLDIGKVKWLSGGDTLTGRHPHGKREITFTPTHKLFLATNHKPHVPADEYAAWERISLIPFALSFVENPSKKNERKNDKFLKQKILKESSGILAWLVRGFLAWQEEGLNPPPAVQEATRKYQKDEDIIGQFIEECCKIDDNEKEQAGPFYKFYKSWCETNGHNPLGSRKYGEKMKELFERKYINGKYYYKGVKVISLIT